MFIMMLKKYPKKHQPQYQQVCFGLSVFSQVFVTFCFLFLFYLPSLNKYHTSSLSEVTFLIVTFVQQILHFHKLGSK